MEEHATPSDPEKAMHFHAYLKLNCRLDMKSEKAFSRFDLNFVEGGLKYPGRLRIIKKSTTDK